MRGVFTSPNKHKTNDKPKNIYKIGHNVRLLKTNEILNASITKELLDALKPITALPEEYFQACYIDLIKNFAGYVNILPSSLQNGLGSLYCNSLYGAYYTLKQFVEESPEADCLWRFAIFSAALLHKANRPAMAFQVTINDPEGAYIDQWNPFVGSLEQQQAQFCKLYELNHIYVHNYAILMGMAIQQIMPHVTLQWLQTNTDLFAQWLDFLQSEEGSAGILGQALEVLLTEQDLIANYDERLHVELVETPTTIAGEALEQWIREGIQNGDIKINTPDAPLHIVRDGLSDALFIDQGVAKQFNAKLAQFSTSAAAAVAQFYAIFGPSQQHALAMSQPGLTRRNSLVSGPSSTIHTGQLLDSGQMFGKNKTPAESPYVQNNKMSISEKKVLINNLTKLESIINDKSNNTPKQQFSNRSFR